MSPALKPEIEIVVPTRNRPELIETTLVSLRASDVTVISIRVIDQSDDEATAAVAARHMAEDPRLHYLKAPPRGISVARNLGIAAGSAPIILFTDDDCRVEPGWARNLAAELADSGNWAVFGRILPETGQLPPEQTVTPGLALGIKLTMQRQVCEGNRFNLGFGHGASMGMRRDRLQLLGGFDPMLGAGAPLRSWEDRDLGYRILKAGGRIIYTPDAVLYHRQWRPWPQIRSTLRDYGIGTGPAAGKYLRLGDWGGALILGEWLIGRGVRQVLSGALKWRSYQKVIGGLQQLVAPWQGLAMASTLSC